MVERAEIKVTGVVQGVGFRPFVHLLAVSCGLTGFVENTSFGVTMQVEGDAIAEFMERLTREAPPLSVIAEVKVTVMPVHGYDEFNIKESSDQGSFTLVPPDISTCADCERELFDPEDRRYLYPFINCTNCGPRFSIITKIPYDRANTTMGAFDMCLECRGEYEDQRDRRFHAEPNACSVCGPQLQFIRDGESKARGDEAFALAVSMLMEGKIVAVKGLGGFHLACNALDPQAVQLLRDRKRKNNKPFALMARGVEAVQEFCVLTDAGRELLLSPRRPIVLLKKKPGCALPEAVAPKNACVGFMLPYTPLHHLLVSGHHVGGVGGGGGGGGLAVLVMTSGNLAEEPIAAGNEEALARLSALADGFLLHNRDIFARADDSVLLPVSPEKQQQEMVREGVVLKDDWGPCVIRRSRGYVPDPVMLEEDGPEVLGCGADLKNTFTLTKGRFAISSQHIGDMENQETLEFYEESLDNLKSLYRVKPEAIAYDAHPDYLSTRWALRQQGILLFPVQHHYAHIASVMAEHALTKKVIGVAFDGTGYGPDGSMWGGEFLICDMFEFKRAGHFRYVPLPGGETAIRQPWRTAISYVHDAYGPDTPSVLKKIGFPDKYGPDVENVLKILKNPSVSPLSSGAGRLFEAVSAMLSLCDENTFEGEAAMALEAVAAEGAADKVIESYPIDVKFKAPMEVDFSLAIIGIINELCAGKDRAGIAAKFHNTVVEALLRVVAKQASLTGIMDVALSGGVFQNSRLLSGAVDSLRREGMRVYVNEVVPPNDAGISLGQAYITRGRLKA